MSRDLERLLEKARRHEMTAEEEREQRRSFVFGNTNIENERITREMVNELDQKLEGQQA